MSQSLLCTPGHPHLRRRPQSTPPAGASADPQTDRLLREVAFICRLTERVKEAVLGGKGGLAVSAA
jgi:hypothetical protein